jgi:hypothetical protein
MQDRRIVTASVMANPRKSLSTTSPMKRSGINTATSVSVIMVDPVRVPDRLPPLPAARNDVDCESYSLLCVQVATGFTNFAIIGRAYLFLDSNLGFNVAPGDD